MAVTTLKRDGHQVEVETYIDSKEELEVHVFMQTTNSANRTFKDEWYFDNVDFHVEINEGEIDFENSYVDLRSGKFDSHIQKKDIEILMDYMKITNVEEGAIKDYAMRYKGVEL